jgi:hypothetical protein
MIFAEAIEFSIKFPVCQPKIFKAFAGWGFSDAGTTEYVVIANLSLARERCYDEVADYVKSHNLRIEYYNEYLMISTIS